MSQDDLTLALLLADRADTVTRDRFGALDLHVDTKPDLTPVTDADRAVETDLREALAQHRPDDSVVGEEFGGTTTFSGRQWIIDPIDGTKNFIRGVPVWASLIALLDDGVPEVGVISAPALQRRWWAAGGAGAFATFGDAPARRISVSSVAQLDSASLSFSSLSGWAQRGLRDRFLDLTDAVWRVRARRASAPSTSPTPASSRPRTSTSSRRRRCCTTTRPASSACPRYRPGLIGRSTVSLSEKLWRCRAACAVRRGIPGLQPGRDQRVPR